ncbi:MAG: hypothetical protein COB78_10530 [Hyphomicrobiales bacterium]|nr:MAG: hypothetical protein COB78_10530 [Hyphomicrobiales bacterium]
MIVERFLEWVDTASVSDRVQATNALARAFLLSDLEDEERESAEAAMTLLLEDPSPDVRLSMADVLAVSSIAPRHIIMALAADVPEISTLIISRSPIFLEAELVDLVATGAIEQQIAIACRSDLSFAVAAAIAEVGPREACLGMLLNPAANCSAKSMHRLAQRHGEAADIRNELFKKENLLAETHILLVEKLGTSLNKLVTSRSWLSSRKADDCIRGACDKAAIGLVANADEVDVDRVVSSLIKGKKISTSFLLRAICTGNITLFARSLSQLSQIPARRVEAMLANDKQAALRAVYTKAGLPENAFGVFLSAISAWRRLLSSDQNLSASRLAHLVTRETLDAYLKAQASSGISIADNLLVLLRKLAAETARESALTKVSEIQNKNAIRETIALPAPMVAKVDMNAFEQDMLDQPDFEDFDIEFQSILNNEVFVIAEDCSDIVSDEEFELNFAAVFDKSADNANTRLPQTETIIPANERTFSNELVA